MREATVRDFWPCLIFGLKVLGGSHGKDTEKDLLGLFMGILDLIIYCLLSGLWPQMSCGVFSSI